MPKPKHLAKLKEGAEAWNEWRQSEEEFRDSLGIGDVSQVEQDGFKVIW